MDQDDHLDRREFVKEIAPDVLEVLKALHLFELLDDRFCPADNAQDALKCGHSFDVTKGILASLRMDAKGIEEVVDVLRSEGACCDCEVLYNFAEESRLRSKYWKARTQS